MQKQKINSLVWFRNNLRVEDNSSLTNAINSSDKIIGFINIDPRNFISTKYGFKFVDGDKYFFKNNKPLSVFHYNLNTHFNKEGNEILSDIVLKNLQN